MMGNWQWLKNYTARLVKARSFWICNECGNKIKKGEQYYKVLNTYMNYGDGIRFHKSCKPMELNKPQTGEEYQDFLTCDYE